MSILSKDLKACSNRKAEQAEFSISLSNIKDSDNLTKTEKILMEIFFENFFNLFFSLLGKYKSLYIKLLLS
jgi:hypothetical protein